MSAPVLSHPAPRGRRSASPRPLPVGPLPVGPPSSGSTPVRISAPAAARSHAPRGGSGVFGPTRHRLGAALRDDAGASTAEYAITVLAACGFAAVLVLLLKSGEVRELLMNIITSALSLGQ